MNKNDFRNLGLFLITPFPQKFHYEGVDNVRVARQLMLIGFAPFVALAVYILGTLVKEEFEGRKDQKARKSIKEQ